MEESKIELFKYARLYLGVDNWKTMKETSSEELALFKQVNMSLNKSYFIMGNRKLLEKFKAFYLTRCLKKRPLYTQCSLYEYADGMSSADKDEFGLNVSKELLFLFMHEHVPSLGNSRKWLTETIINKVADRNIKGLVTIILSEVEVEEFEKCGELEVIDFQESIRSKNTVEILQSFQHDEESKNNGSSMYS